MAKRDINLLDEFVRRRGVVDSRFLKVQPEVNL